jgi:hypothetical protein
VTALSLAQQTLISIRAIPPGLSLSLSSLSIHAPCRWYDPTSHLPSNALITSTTQNVPAECIPAFKKVRDQEARFVTYKVDAESMTVSIDKQGDINTSPADFAAALPEDGCRWAFYSCPQSSAPGAKDSVLLFIKWSPDYVPGIVSASHVQTSIAYATVS